MVGCLAERYGRQLAESLPEAQAGLGFDDYTDIAARLDGALAGVFDLPPKDKETEVSLALIVSRILSLVMDTRNRVPKTQADWRWCKKCEGLFFAGRPTKGVCPAGGEHTTQGSGKYEVIHK